MIKQTPPVLGVRALNQRIERALGDLGSLMVSGELSSCKVAASGHCYLTLTEGKDLIQGVLWRSTVARLGAALPREGTHVQVRGSLNVYGPRGSYSLVITAIQAMGVGDLAAQFEALKIALTEEGLFDPAHKKPLPVLPRAVGLATGSGSAALADMRQGLSLRFPQMPVFHAPCVVQGTGAAASIAAALRLLDHHPEVDVIICGRGGGSLEDLWAFNEEVVVRAIAACTTPVISAVGHETDTTLADLVADERAKTPSTAAERAVPERAALQERLQEDRRALDQSLGWMLQQYRQQLTARQQHRALAQPELLVQHRLERCALAQQRLQRAAQHVLQRDQQRLSAQAEHLEALSPLQVLSRGYAVLQKTDGSVIQASSQTQVGDTVMARLQHDSLHLTVIDHAPAE